MICLPFLIFFADNKSKIDFNMKFSVVSNEVWVKVSNFLDLMNISRTFSVCVNPSCLGEGVHSTL